MVCLFFTIVENNGSQFLLSVTPPVPFATVNQGSTVNQFVFYPIFETNNVYVNYPSVYLATATRCSFKASYPPFFFFFRLPLKKKTIINFMCGRYFEVNKEDIVSLLYCWNLNWSIHIKIGYPRGGMGVLFPFRKNLWVGRKISEL